MPVVSEGNAKVHLFTVVEKFTEITGEQLGMAFTSKGNITVIGKEPLWNLSIDIGGKCKLH